MRNLRKKQKRESILARSKNRLKRRFGNSKKNRNQKATTNPPDLRVILIVTWLLAVGLLMIFSASAPTVANKVEYNSDAFFFVKRQLAWIFVGGILAAIITFFPLDFFRRNSVFFLSIGIFFLLIIAIEAVLKINLPFVIERNGAVRWIDIGVTEIQIAEFIKLAYVIYASAWLSSIEKLIKKNMDFEDHLYILLKFFNSFRYYKFACSSTARFRYNSNPSFDNF